MSSMMAGVAEPWNKVNVPFPGAVSSVRIHITAATDENVDKLLLENDKVLMLLRSQILQTEVRLLYELLYVLHYNYGGNRTFRALKQVEQCINRLKEMKLDAALQDLTDLCPTKFQRELSMSSTGIECELPSQPMLEWLCLKVLGAAQLLSCTMTHCGRAFTLSKQTLKWEEFIILNVVITAMLSRLWVFFRGILANLVPLYTRILRLHGEVSRARPMPYLKDYSLPEDVVQFLGPSEGGETSSSSSSLMAETTPPSASAARRPPPTVSRGSTRKEPPDYPTLERRLTLKLTRLRWCLTEEDFARRQREVRKKLRWARAEIKEHKTMLKTGKPRTRTEMRKERKRMALREDQRRAIEMLKMEKDEDRMTKKRFEGHDMGVPVKRVGICDDIDGKALCKLFKDFTEESAEPGSSTRDDAAAAVAVGRKQMFHKQVNTNAATFPELAAHLEDMMLWCRSHRLRRETRLLSFVRLKCRRMKHLESAGFNVQRKLGRFKREACWASSPPTGSVPTSFRSSVSALRRRRRARRRTRFLRFQGRSNHRTARAVLHTESDPHESHGKRPASAAFQKPARRTSTQVDQDVLAPQSGESATSSKIKPLASLSESGHDEIDDIFAAVGF